MDLEPANVIVAVVDIDGAVKLHEEAPKRLKVRTGQLIHIKFLYSQHTGRRDRQAYSYHLDGTFAGQVKHDELKHHNVPLFHNEFDGALVAAFDAGKGGVLEYSAEVRYAHGSWIGKLGKPEAQRVAGKMRVDVVN